MNEKGNNLLTRTATGAVFVAVVLAAMLLGRGSYFVLLFWINWLCVNEFLRLSSGRVTRWTGLYIVLCTVAMGFFPVMGGGMTDGEGLWECRRAVVGGWPEGWDARVAPAFIIVVWANDVFAYLVGVTAGRHKMAPRLSPNKSWEGFVGGLVGATVTSAAVGRLWLGGNVWLWTAFGFVVALAAVGGDLAESRLKRAAGVKDSGRLLPGHGGVLDRFDAMLGAVPAAFLFLLVTHLCR
jgi:CDP-diglyceride synthetase